MMPCLAEVLAAGFGGPGFGGHMMGYLSRKLELTDAQQSQVKEIMAKEKPTFQPLILQMAQNHQQMRQLVMANGFDEAKVREMAAQQTQTLTELTVQRARVESELYQVLTPRSENQAGNHYQSAPAALHEPHAGPGAGSRTDAEPVVQSLVVGIWLVRHYVQVAGD